MFEIQCPRCNQYWYSNEKEVGRARLCERCGDALRRKRGKRSEIDLPFLIAVAMVLFFNLMMFALTVVMPEVFGKVMLGLALLLWAGGWITLRVLGLQGGGLSTWFFPFSGEIDWHIGRWAILMIVSALFLFGSYGAFVGLTR